MMAPEARSTAVPAYFQFDEPVPLHPGSVSEVGEDSDAAPAEQI